MKPQYFIGSSILAVGLLLKTGAPVAALAAGIAVAGFFYWLRQRGAHSR
jgi:hypothetical protein